MSLSLDGKCDQEQRVFRHSGVTGREIGVMMSRTPLFCRTLARSTRLWGRTVTRIEIVLFQRSGVYVQRERERSDEGISIYYVSVI